MSERGGKKFEPEQEPDLGETIAWNPEFSTRRSLVGICEDENIPWLELRARAIEKAAEEEQEDDQECGEEASEGDEDSPVQIFMRDDESPDFSLPDADAVEDFTFGASLGMLQAKTWRGPDLSRKAWVGEGGEHGFKASPQWLTAHGLYWELKKPRFRCHRPPQVPPADDARAASGNTRGTSVAKPVSATPPEPKFDIDRRLIFVADPDNWTIYALVGTATGFQVAALRDAFAKYLAFESSIEVTTSTAGWPVFQFSLHLPYFAWRNTPTPIKDPRRDRRNRPLRQCRNVSFLDSKGEIAYLYESQISCVLAGIDEWRWVAYCFVDSFFDGNNGENAFQYLKDLSDGTPTDPFEYGVAVKPKELARTFFLKVFEIRVKQITREWARVVMNVEKSINRYSLVSYFAWRFLQSRFNVLGLTSLKDNEPDHPEPTHTHVTEEATKQYGLEIRQSLDWFKDTSWVLHRLRNVLEGSLDSCQNFTRQSSIFRDLSAEDRTNDALCVIQNSFHRLSTLRKKLSGLAFQCDGIQQQLQCKLKRHELDVGDYQRKLAETSYQLAETNKKMSQIMMSSFPLALAAAIFSMHPSAIPFPLSHASFLVAFIVLCILCLGIYHWELSKNFCQKQGVDLARRMYLCYEQLLLTLVHSAGRLYLYFARLVTSLLHIIGKASPSMRDAETGGTNLTDIGGVPALHHQTFTPISRSRLYRDAVAQPQRAFLPR